MENKDIPYEVIIQADRNWFSFDIQGLFHYRDLLFLLVRRDFVSKYKQTILGPLWFILQPLLTTAVMTIVFGNFAKIPTDKVPPVLFYMCGLLFWNYFAQNFTSTSQALIANAHIFSKVYFPRLIVPLSVVMSNLLALALQSVVFLGFYIYFKCFGSTAMLLKPNLFLLALPLLALQTAAVSLGVGLWISALTVKYRDFHHLTGFVVQLWMYATPVIYPASMVPEKWWVVIALNPMTGIVESCRYAFFGTGFLTLRYLLISAVMTILLLVSGVLMFNKAERTFVDTI